MTAAYGMFACRALPDVVRPRERHGGTEAVWPHEDLLESRMGILVLSGAILNGLSGNFQRAERPQELLGLEWPPIAHA